MSVKTAASLFACAEKTLGLGVFFDQRDALGIARRRLEKPQRFRVDREDAAGRAIFRRHIGDGRAVFERHGVETRTVKLDEFSDHALLAQHLRHGENEIGRGAAGAQLARKLEADDFGDQHRDRLAEHRRFRFDAADAPTENRKPVDHRRVRVGADDGIGIGVFDRGAFAFLDLVGPHRLAEIFEIDLVADAGARRHDAEPIEALLAPAQKRIALAVAFIFQRHVLS